jgi:integrase
MESPAPWRRWKGISPNTSCPDSESCQWNRLTKRRCRNADLKRSTFERRKADGTLIKTYRLSRKTVLNIVGVVKLVLGRKVWMLWELDLGKPIRAKQRYFTQEQLRQIIEAAPAQYRILFALLAGTGMRIGEAAGLHSMTSISTMG